MGTPQGADNTWYRRKREDRLDPYRPRVLPLVSKRQEGFWLSIHSVMGARETYNLEIYYRQISGQSRFDPWWMDPFFKGFSMTPLGF